MAMRIDIRDLQQGKKSFDYVRQSEELSLDEDSVRLASPLTVSGEASLEREEIYVQGVMRGQVEAMCDRCLRWTPLYQDLSFEAHLIPAASYYRDQTAELQNEDLNYSVFDGETIDLDELVREQMLLSVPVQVLCAAECRGLCSECGTDLNRQQCACETPAIDPRWSALAVMKDAPADDFID
ncbi:MAG: DUF177 domain-containing protein [Pyrinomonadaceae bacterium]